MYHLFLVNIQETSSWHVVTASASISEHSITHVTGDCKLTWDVTAIDFVCLLLKGQHLEYTFRDCPVLSSNREMLQV